MKILGLDTAQGACSAALWDDGSSIARRFELMRTGHAERLMPQALEVMEEAGVQMSDLDRLACTIGPGTFTGTRVALSAARGMVLALKIPLIGVTTLEAVAAGLEPGAGKIRVGAFDARRGELYVQAFSGEDLLPFTDPQLLTVAAAAEAVAHVAAGGSIEIAGTGAGLLVEAMDSGEVRAPDVKAHPDAALVAQIAALRDIPDLPPAPLYLREPDATIPEPK